MHYRISRDEDRVIDFVGDCPWVPKMPKRIISKIKGQPLTEPMLPTYEVFDSPRIKLSTNFGDSRDNISRQIEGRIPPQSIHTWHSLYRDGAEKNCHRVVTIF